MGFNTREVLCQKACSGAIGTHNFGILSTTIVGATTIQRNSIFYSENFYSKQRTTKRAKNFKGYSGKELLCSICMALSQATSKRMYGKAQSWYYELCMLHVSAWDL